MVVTAASLLAVAATLTATPAPALADQLDQPTDVQVTAGRRALAVTWQAPPVDEATGYTSVDHYVATSSGGQTCVTTGLTCTIVNGVLGNTRYTVSVVACPVANDNYTDCSEPSDTSEEVLTGPPAVPATPTVSYTGVAGQVRVSWVQAAPTSGIDTFKVTPTPAVATGSQSGTCIADLPDSATSCTFGGLTAGTSYTFKVAAVGVGSTGTSATSVATAAIVAGPPNVPGTPAVAHLSDTSVRLTWTAPGSGPTVGSYTVTSNPVVASADCTNVAALTCDFAGLTASTSYTFKVHANGAGTGGGSGPSAESTASAAITPGAPGPVSKPGVSVTDEGEVTVTWTAPTGGATPVDYTVTSIPAATPTDSCLGSVASSPCVFDGLDAATSYTFKVQANGAGAASLSPASDAVVPGPPEAPAKPTAVVSDVSQVTVTWLEPGGGAVTDYSVSSDIDGPVTDCQNISALECIVTGLDDEVTYTFTVTANGAVGTPAVSPSSDAVLPGAPSAVNPTVRATGLGQLTVEWNAPSGGAVSDYTVAAGQGNATIPGTCLGTVTRSCVVTNLNEATAYSFTVSTRGAVGTAVPSAESAAVIPGPPATPAAPVATVTGSGQVGLTWSAPGGGPVASYSITSVPSATIPGGCTNTQSTSCTVTGLTGSTSYVFKVTATGVVGTPAVSTSSNIVIPGPPGAVAKPTIEVSDVDELTIRWTEPSGGPVSSYTVTSNDGIDPGCTNVQALECVVGGLTSSEDYSFTVTANAVAGASPVSPSTDAVFPDAPGTPDEPIVQVTGEGTVDVTWTAPTGGAVTAYTLESDPAQALPTDCVGTTNLTCSITELDPTTPISFKVVVGNAIDSSVESAATAPVIPGPPDVPAAPTATVTAPSSVTVEWVQPTGLGEATDYTVVSDPLVVQTGGCEFTSSLTCVYTGLDAATSYTFTVKAMGDGGDSEFSSASNAVIPGPPLQPDAPSIQVTAAGTVELTWTAPGGGPITNWTVLTAANATVPGCTNQSTLTCTITSLNTSQAVKYKVRANAPGGNVTSPLSAEVIPGPPTAPAAPTVTLTAAGQAEVRWDPSAGGGSVTGYSVTSSPGVSPPSGCTGTTSHSCVFTGLNQAVEYTFTVTATGPGGSSTSTASTGAIAAAPGAPGTPVATLSTRSQATLNWPAPTTGGAVTGYTVTSSPVVATPAACSNITARTCVFTGLNEETSYTFVVRAANGIGGADSATSNAVVPGPPTAPGTPTVSSATAGVVTVTWTPSGGGVLTSYSVTSQPSTSPPSACTAITATTCQFSGLVSNTRYRFTVTATGPLGSTPSAQSDSIVPGAPNTPSTPTVVSIARDAVRVSWSIEAGGSAITGYRVTSQPVVTPPTACTGTTNLTCDFSGLDPSTAYRFTVTAVNAVGNSPSAASEEIVPGRPAAPADVTVATGDRQFAVSWTAPEQATQRVAYYRVTTTPAGGECRTVDATETECILIGLENLRWYTVEVVAVGTGTTGDSPAGRSRLVRPTAGAPGSPTAVLASGRNGSALVSWTAPAAVGNGIVRYTATATATIDATDAHACVTTSVTALSCVVPDLTNLREYRVTVVAIGRAASGNSAPSTPVSVTPSLVPAAPTNVQVTAGAKNLTVTFAHGEGGGTATGFTATATGGTTPLTCPTTTAAATSCVISGVTPGTNYTVTVVGHGTIAGAVSEASAPVGPVKGLLAAAPAPPTSVPSSSGSVTSSAGTAVRLNGVTTITGTGYAPNTGITIGIYPGAYRLATTTTDATGAFSASVTIAGVTPGTTAKTLVAGGQSSATSTTLKWKTISLVVGAAVSAQEVNLQRSAGLPVLMGKRD
ncbi:fibronectin type III domain-containing protein [Actinoplanes sp. CA-015351]|uniref:fibronectin type III domain-containing protein n=1 Tax=Actinoplanes sp. CA-015351 TaxID=3239897 RepID=UPI003D986947